MLKLTDSVDTIPLIGPKYKELLNRLEINTVKDLLFYFPSKYRDTRIVSQVSELTSEEKRTIKVIIDDIKNISTKFRKSITQAKAHDNSGNVNIIWFNQRFISRILKPGSKALLNGKLGTNRNKSMLVSPEYELVKGNTTTHLGMIVPTYPTTEGITSKWIRSRVHFLIKNYTFLLDKVKDNTPQNIQNSYALCNLPHALEQIHFPKDQKSLKEARKRIAFDELFAIQIQLLKRSLKRRKNKSPDVKQHKEKVKTFLASLEFKPTKAQSKVINEIISDFKRSYPSNRLLQGDVGCGKTVVAAAISMPVIESGLQVAILAPTAILAKQHHETFKELLGKEYKIQLVTGKTEQSNNKTIEQFNVIIGTHALLHRYETLFDNVGLVIIDEQHRFGVKQRETLVSWSRSNIIPHKVTMTATPIPRSIALTLFGDLDISIIDEMPKGRLPTQTHIVPATKRLDAYKWVGDMIQGKNQKHSLNSQTIRKNSPSQVFWLCPLIEESEKLQTKAVMTEYEKLETEIFPNLKIDLLHGRLSEEEKNNKILRMREGKTNILVSTSVIEVGMDIPNANIIVIEGAERFGLAQLHQLRGRVGRKAGSESWCLLFMSRNASPLALKRLKYFSKTTDGMKVAESDLENRGPGEVYGTKQAGIPDLKVASFSDIKLIKQTREAAMEILENKKF